MSAGTIETCPCPKLSPWGKVDGYPERMGDGIYFVSTASHGGVWLSPERVKEVRKRIGNFIPYTGQFQWWEEDYDATLAIYALREHIDSHEVTLAHRYVRSMSLRNGKYGDVARLLLR